MGGLRRTRCRIQTPPVCRGGAHPSPIGVTARLAPSARVGCSLHTPSRSEAQSLVHVMYTDPILPTGSPYIRPCASQYRCGVRAGTCTCAHARSAWPQLHALRRTAGAFGAALHKVRLSGRRRKPHVDVRMLGGVDIVELVRVLRPIVEGELLACGDVTRGQPLDVEPSFGEDDAGRRRALRVVEERPLKPLGRWAGVMPTRASS